MESSNDLKPKISIIVPAMLGYNSVLAALNSWEAQHCRDQLEILVLCPTGPNHPIPPGHVVVETGSMLLHEARAAGVRRAAADFVMFAEDHCLPDPECAAALILRIEEPWDAVGTALRSGNPSMAVTQGSFLISYSQWMLPVRGTNFAFTRPQRRRTQTSFAEPRSGTRRGTFVCRVLDAAFTRPMAAASTLKIRPGCVISIHPAGPIRPYFFHDRNWIWCDRLQAFFNGGTSALRAASAADRGAAFWSRTHRLLARWSASGVRPEGRNHGRNSCVRLGMGRNSRRMARA